MKFAFCFLTYKNIIHTSQWEPYLKKNNVYIHPKEPDYISRDYRRFVIPSIISTSWGDRSIVDATILLLEQAILDNDNKWFILCSEDSCPLKPYLEFASFFETQSMSILNVMDNTINKTSQWWALCRDDVKLLLKNKAKFNKIFENISKKYKTQGAVDELFFLNALKQFKKNYAFKNGCVHYVKWFSEWTSKHPTTFNRLLEEDIENINNNSCWFIRKTFPTFQTQLIEKEPTCIVMCIGSESTGNYSDFLDYFTGKANIFLLVMDPKKLVDQTEIKEKCEQVFYVVWNMADIAMEVLYNKFILTYDNVFILKENFNYTGISYPSEQTESLEFLKTNRNVYIPPISSSVAIERALLPPPAFSSKIPPQVYERENSKVHHKDEEQDEDDNKDISNDEHKSNSKVVRKNESKTNKSIGDKSKKTHTNPYAECDRLYGTDSNSPLASGVHKNKTKKRSKLTNKKYKLTKTRINKTKRKNNKQKVIL